MNKELETKHVNPFEKIKQVKDDNIEFWYARDLAIILEYKDWRNFLNVINKAKEACKNSNQNVSNHFGDITKMVELGSGSKREIDDIALSRYACYLIIQNADHSKEIIAKGQTYFAIQTRKQELQEFNVKTEEEKRLLLRQEMKTHNKQLADAAKDVGVIQPLDYAIFQDSGYKGLYGGLT